MKLTRGNRVGGSLGQVLRRLTMTEDEIRNRADDLLSELTKLDPLTTSQRQRRQFKEARDQLKRAIDTGARAALQLGSYYLANVRASVQEVQDAKRKDVERTTRRSRPDGDTIA